MTQEICPPLLCPHGNQYTKKKTDIIQCNSCDSFWDLKTIRNKDSYDSDYPTTRSHLDSDIGKLKQQTLAHFLKISKTSVRDKCVCEVGFGGGQTLSLLDSYGASIIMGIEAIKSNIENAVNLGIPKGGLFQYEMLPAELPHKVDLWIFLDSFEHLPSPWDFMKWLLKNTSAKGQLLLVAPRADSISAKLMGGFWPHRIPDHRFHWSSKGIDDFCLEFGFSLKTNFYPAKAVSSKMLFTHLFVKTQNKIFRGLAKWTPLMQLKFNVGQMGKVFERVTLSNREEGL